MIDLGGCAAVFTAPTPIPRCQRRSIVGMIANSTAISACVRPLVSYKATASRLNSGIKYRFRIFAIVHLLAPKSQSSVSAKARDDLSTTLYFSPIYGPPKIAGFIKQGQQSDRLHLQQNARGLPTE